MNRIDLIQHKPTRTRLHRKPRRFLGLKARTWISVILIVLILLIISLFGWLARLNEKITETANAAILMQTAYAQKPLPTPSPMTLAPLPEREANIALIKKIWGKDAETGLAIAKCESGYRTGGTHVANTNKTVDQGVFSINSVHGMPEMENAVANISYAYTMFLKQGTTPWDSSKACWGGQI